MSFTSYQTTFNSENVKVEPHWIIKTSHLCLSLGPKQQLTIKSASSSELRFPLVHMQKQQLRCFASAAHQSKIKTEKDIQTISTISKTQSELQVFSDDRIKNNSKQVYAARL